MGLVGQNQQTNFANPANGQSPMDADVVRNNDNALVSKLNAHDADATIHVQTGLLSARPAATTPYAMYLDENRRLYVANGSVWTEVPYARLDAVGTNAFANNVSVGGTLGVTGLSTLGSVNAGAVSATSVSASTVSGTLSGNGASITNLNAASLTGALPAVSGASLTNLNASNITSGTLDEARISTLTASKLTGALPAISGASLTNLNGSNIASGTVAAARLPAVLTAGTEIGGMLGRQSTGLSGAVVLRYTSGAQPAAIDFDTTFEPTAGSGAFPTTNGSYPFGVSHSQWRWIRSRMSDGTMVYIPVSVPS